MTLPKAASASVKNRLELICGQHGHAQVVLARQGNTVTDAYYQHLERPNLVGLVAPCKISEIIGPHIFATLPNGAMGKLEAKPPTNRAFSTGHIVPARVTAYVTGSKAWPLKLAPDSTAQPPPSLIARISALHNTQAARDDNEYVADWLAQLKPQRLLAQGASLIIESTSTLTTIDLNSGRLKNTAQLIAQLGPAVADALRHYQLGGAIVVDAAFMAPTARKGLADKIKQQLAQDPLAAKVISVTKMGLIEITRARYGPNAFEVL